MTALAMTQHPPAKLFPEWMTRKLAARFLQKIGCPISARTLNRMAENDNRVGGGGPPFNRVRNRAFYNRDELEAWARKVTVRVE